MLKRKIDQYLLEWKNREDHNPLILYGPRQVGKTTSVEEFGKNNYESLVSINFITNPEYKSVFDNFNPDDICRKLSLYNPEFKFIPNNTLIFFDEIQDYMQATTALKFFKLDGKYDVICSGSKLGVTNSEISSVAVGYKEEKIMYSMDFEEFLWAKGYDSNLIERIVESMSKGIKLDDATLEVMNKSFMDYVIVGGYPRIVNDFLKNGNYSNTLFLQRNLLNDYKSDAIKYLRGLDVAKVLKIYDSIPSQLAKENHKFQFTKVSHGARFSSHYECMQWLKNSGVVLLSNNIPLLELPLKGNEDDNNFRAYFSDTSLLIASLDEETATDLLTDQNLNVYKGAMYENIAVCALNKQGYDLYFHRSEDSTIELDSLVRFKNEIIPIEVKAKQGRHRSLSTAMETYRLERGLKFGNYNIGQSENVLTLPLFAISFLKKYLEKIRKNENT
ncbi:MAG: ATP-binding protein [Erysipelotrichaceae bacterium]|nr:ATP-binding protein [Erysipelotrichaceae bacterium]